MIIITTSTTITPTKFEKVGVFLQVSFHHNQKRVRDFEDNQPLIRKKISVSTW